VESRRKRSARSAARSIGKSARKEESATVVPSLPNIEALVAYGEITLGEKYPMGCIAIASDEHNTLAMLKRRERESLAQLLIRLDQAIAKAQNEDIFTDEINSPPKPLRR
jgi:hypothetical protein